MLQTGQGTSLRCLALSMTTHMLLTTFVLSTFSNLAQVTICS